MTTINPTFDHYSEHHREIDYDAPRTRSRRRTSVRAFALGATIAGLCVGGAWAAIESSHSHGAAASQEATPAATTHARTSAGSDRSTTTGSNSSSGSHSGTPANTNPHGPDVETLQRELGQLNYYESPINGVYGPATIAAIKDFQRANGLVADGIAGPSTMAKIKQQLITGDNQMGPSGPPAKSTNNTPGHANNAPATGHGANPSGGAAASASSSAPAA
ncbi:MAG: peptidoglycan-binding protein [Solirubrobacterales bacterium]|nr:peptidoglycan-binding protein [Solirubrobacterales bacterium]